MLTYFGVDPGVGGALAVLQKSGDDWTARVWSTPRAVDKTTKNRGYDIDEMARLVREIRHGNECYACMEAVNSRPGEGHVGSFSFGFGWGVWQGIFGAYQIPRWFVDPKKWKNALKLEFTADRDRRKEYARALAIQNFPELKQQLGRKMDHDRAEALLICHWFRDHHFAYREMAKPFLWDKDTLDLVDVDKAQTVDGRSLVDFPP